VLEPQTTGALRVMVHVENLTQQVTITIATEPGGGAPGSG
jgi:anti-sigma-K factor RskA